MKRIKISMEDVASIDNIKESIKLASRNKGLKAIDFMQNIDATSRNIQNILLSGEYKPSDYIVFKKTENNGKVRIIHAPKFFPDQIIHWCLMNVVSKHLFISFIRHTCACIPGRGVHFAKRITEKYCKQFKYCLQFDMSKFFPSIDQDILIRKLKDKFKGDEVLHLMENIIKTTEFGIPLGNYTSQWFANFYLTDFDKYCKQDLKIQGYVRYMDDILIFGNNKRELIQKFIKIEEYMHSILNLNIKPTWKLIVVKDNGIDFIGFRFYKTHTLIRKSICKRMLRVSKSFYRCNNIHDAHAMMSYNGYLVCTDTNTLYNTVSEYSPIKYCKRYIVKYYKKQLNN